MSLDLSGTLFDGWSQGDIRAMAELCRRDHLTFTRLMFAAREKSPFLVGPHHEVMCKTLDRVVSGEIKRLIINVPPGYTKTETAVIAFVARGFAVNPNSRFLHASYSEQLVNQNSTSIRDTVQLPEYQAMYPMAFRVDTNAKGLWRTSEGGMFKASPAGGAITGFRAGYMTPGFSGALIIDDPLKPDDASSDVTREFINQRYMNTFRSRLAHEDVPIVVIMQRVHGNDFSAHLLQGAGGEKWHHLVLPIVIDNARGYPAEYTHGIPIDHGLADGPLWLAKHTIKQIDVLRRDALTFAAQYMQDPGAGENPMFAPQFMRPFEVRPRTLNIAIMVDSARSVNKRSDRTAMAVIGIDANNNKYLLDGYCHRMKLSERWESLKNLYQKWSKAIGVQGVFVGYEKFNAEADLDFIHERQEVEGVRFPIEPLTYARSGSSAKEYRIQRLQPDFEHGRFYMPATIYRRDQGGDCFWRGQENGVEYWRSRGITSAQRRMEESGEGWRNASPIKRVDETGQLYDLSEVLMSELKAFPHAAHDDLSDCVSRIYDIDANPVNKGERDAVEHVNESIDV